MLKHKIRKSRKNILSLLDLAQQEEEAAQEKLEDSGYSEIKKSGKKSKKTKNGEKFLQTRKKECCFQVKCKMLERL